MSTLISTEPVEAKLQRCGVTGASFLPLTALSVLLSCCQNLTSPERGSSQQDVFSEQRDTPAASSKVLSDKEMPRGICLWGTQEGRQAGSVLEEILDYTISLRRTTRTPRTPPVHPTSVH